MKIKCVKRRIDGLGRVVLPKNFRDTLNMTVKASIIQISVESKIGKRIKLVLVDDVEHSEGVARKIDELGRIVLDRKLRYDIFILPGSFVWISLESDAMYIDYFGEWEELAGYKERRLVMEAEYFKTHECGDPENNGREGITYGKH